MYIIYMYVIYIIYMYTYVYMYVYIDIDIYSAIYSVPTCSEKYKVSKKHSLINIPLIIYETYEYQCFMKMAF